MLSSVFGEGELAFGSGGNVSALQLPSAHWDWSAHTTLDLFGGTLRTQVLNCLAKQSTVPAVEASARSTHAAARRAFIAEVAVEIAMDRENASGRRKIGR